MDITVGWNTEFGRDKFSVTLDDEDLKDILAESNLTVDQVQTGEKFAILRAYANYLSALEAIRFDAAKQEDASRWAKSYSEAVGDVIARLYPQTASPSVAA